MPRRREHQGGARPLASALRCGSHNVNGLLSPQRLETLATDWRVADFQIVFLQETHLTFSTHSKVERQLKSLGWTSFFSHATLSPPTDEAPPPHNDGGAPPPPPIARRPRGGTAILFRTYLLSTGALTLPSGPNTQHRAASGRYVALRAHWCGHRLHLCSIYMPNDAAAQRQLISTGLVPLAAAATAAGYHLLWGGDFNFAPSIPLDRLSRAASVGAATHPDVTTQRRWREALPDLRDAFRARHPGRRAFTYVHSQHASRLDRFYVSTALLSRVPICSVRPRTCSDHRPISLTLTGLLPTVGRGHRRVHVGFLKSPSLCQQLSDWLELEVLAAPEDHHALLLWWPLFKRRLAAVSGRLHRASRTLSLPAEGLAAQLTALSSQVDAGEEGALPAYVAARQQYAAAAAASTAEDRLRRRHDWLHVGERPSPGLTARLRPRRQDRVVPALRGAGGGLLPTGTACARRVATFWAEVSAQPAVSPTAQAEVLHSLAGGRHLAPAAAAGLGATVIQPAEVKRAIRTAPSGRSPGLDGIPVELYRHFRDAFIPLLARLFTAIATTGDLPPRFHEGLITILHKSGEQTDPANYRPITLLSTDYRLYAKVLALRLNPCLQDVIDPEQTAFVPGRCIGENIMLLQCLPHLLRQPHPGPSSAVIAFCDFRKAYDTVDRGFLLRALAALGLGDSFVSLVRRLLTGTKARAVVNGHVSTPAAFAAGVRQGCPLAPLLYLFVAQALLRHLKDRLPGLSVAGRTLAAALYADDAEVLLPSLSEVPAFLAAMATFGSATGQHLNYSKTVLLPIGNVPAGLPESVHGLKVVTCATALGTQFGPDANPDARWTQLLATVKACYGKLASLPSLSMFGRGFAASAYGVSQALYHAEFAGLPPPEILHELDDMTSRLVVRGASPTAAPTAFASIAAWALPGRPANGGFGVLPWAQHITSRHARWALRLILGSDDTPWIAVARELLCRCAGDLGAHPSGLLGWELDAPLRGRATPLPPPLRRLHAALRQIPMVGALAHRPPGRWCWAVPLWGNPIARSPAYPHGIDLDFQDFMFAGVTTLGQLVLIDGAVAATSTHATYGRVRAERLRGSYAFAERHVAVERIAALLSTLPPAWVEAARLLAPAVEAGTAQPPLPQEGLTALLSSVGWMHRGRPLSLPAFTVRVGTELLLRPVEERREQRYLAPFAAAASPAGGATSADVLAMFDRLWRVRWENQHKETFWRLAFDGLPTAARLHVARGCQCGAAGPADRRHHYWACPVAQAVASTIGTAAGADLTATNIWLARPPLGVHGGVWDVVCLAAVAAMDHGRRRMYAMSQRPPSQTSPRLVASSSAVAHFWRLLSDFVSLRSAPHSWRDHTPPGHPFIHFHPHSSSFVLNPPVAYVAPV